MDTYKVSACSVAYGGNSIALGLQALYYHKRIPQTFTKHSLNMFSITTWTFKANEPQI